MRTFNVFTAISILFLALSVSPARAKSIHVVTTTPDLASIARDIGGDRVKVDSLASPVQDPHFVDAKPSLIVKLMKTDLFIETGMELEVGWAPVLVQSSGNPRIQANAPGHLDASRAIAAIEVPQNPSRAMGDVHPSGNPHYLADPENGKLVAELICEKLSALSPADSGLFKKNLAAFSARIDENMKRWASALEPYKGAKFVSYHKDVAYFAKRFGLVSVGEIEPKPGIPPTAQHTAELIERMKSEKVALILSQPWHNARAPESIARATGATVVTMDLFPGATPGAADYVGAVHHNVESILNVLSRAAKAQ